MIRLEKTKDYVPRSRSVGRILKEEEREEGGPKREKIEGGGGLSVRRKTYNLSKIGDVRWGRTDLVRSDQEQDEQEGKKEWDGRLGEGAERLRIVVGVFSVILVLEAAEFEQKRYHSTPPNTARPTAHISSVFGDFFSNKRRELDLPLQNSNRLRAASRTSSFTTRRVVILPLSGSAYARLRRSSTALVRALVKLSKSLSVADPLNISLIQTPTQHLNKS
ncbi:hypothetical protein DFH28DRAFT_930219 [Melampsora americana]|nr:hypothetical protein DFH28DRAFT_930219 [Melampsora americana]